jgi:hypothetical protein
MMEMSGAASQQALALDQAVIPHSRTFCRDHQTPRVTPAMEAGLTDHVWSLEELVGLLVRRLIQVAA